MSKTVQGRVDSAQFRALAGKSSRLDPALRRALRKNIRQAVQPAVQDVKQTVLGGEYVTEEGLRQGLADSVKVTLMTGKRAGVQIRSTGSALPADKRKLVRAWDKPGGWRHPVWKTGKWVQQMGRPYFASRIKTHQAEVTQAVVDAMNEAAKTLQ